jgi:hypothetical protein
LAILAACASSSVERIGTASYSPQPPNAAKTSSPTGITFISIVNQHDEEPRAAQSTPENPERLQPPRHSRLNNRPVRQQNYEEHLAQWSFDRIGERNEPKRDRRRAEFLSLQCADLDVVENRHKVGGDFSHSSLF